MSEIITSRSNPRIAKLRELLQKSGRESSGRMLIEGTKLLREALRSGLRPLDVLYEPSYAQANGPLLSALSAAGARMTPCAAHVLETLCAAKTPQGAVASVALPRHALPDVLHGNWVALECVQDPGNVGSILRSADAFGYAGALISPDSADAFSPKAMRASMGSAFHIAVCEGNIGAAIPAFRHCGYTVVASHLAGSPQAIRADKKLLIIGNESSGLSDELRDMADALYRIEMKGAAESLGAAAAAAVMLYALQ